MNILEKYRQKVFADTFNAAESRVVNFSGFLFDVRVINDRIYCFGVPMDEFLDECMFAPEEREACEKAIKEALLAPNP